MGTWVFGSYSRPSLLDVPADNAMQPIRGLEA
jgi:hypothetical protein